MNSIKCIAHHPEARSIRRDTLNGRRADRLYVNEPLQLTERQGKRNATVIGGKQLLFTEFIMTTGTYFLSRSTNGSACNPACAGQRGMDHL